MNIVKGLYEPTEEESKCTFDGDETTDEQTKKAGEEGGGNSREVNEDIFSQKKFLEKAVGIPEFWLQVFKNSEVISDLIKVSSL